MSGSVSVHTGANPIPEQSHKREHHYIEEPFGYGWEAHGGEWHGNQAGSDEYGQVHY